MVEHKKQRNKDIERRSEPRTIVDRFSSVEFSMNDLIPSYIFKIRDLSSLGMGIMVKEGSGILEHLKVGDIFNLKYNPSDKLILPEYLRTEVRHITKNYQGKYEGHYLIGLSILEKHDDNSR